MPAHVYMLLCADGSYYVGSTRNITARVAQHEAGLGGTHTSGRLPVTLVFSQECESVAHAWGLERKLHGWSHAKRKALAEGRFDDLPGLSRNRRNRE
ncbi:GIY-YIG nuclease family protein [Gordonia sp. CPCC 205515]|uniref:GIY-YIG nuclease family protein n=1 Tax=Gordonia sp. CPCC 205515 TaxID=3140791 RepID=UPI003AF38E3B